MLIIINYIKQEPKYLKDNCLFDFDYYTLLFNIIWEIHFDYDMLLFNIILEIHFDCYTLPKMLNQYVCSYCISNFELVKTLIQSQNRI